MLMLVGAVGPVACASDDPVAWADGACADFASEVSGDLDSRSFPEPSTVGEMREIFVDAGAPAPSEWTDLDDDDLVAECTYNLDAGASEEDPLDCPGGAQSGEMRQATYLVDEAGHGVLAGSTC